MFRPILLRMTTARRERRIQLILPNVDQPDEARIGVVVLRPICTEWLQRAAPSNRVEHDRVNVAQASFTSSGYNHEEQNTAGWLTPNDDGLTR